MVDTHSSGSEEISIKTVLASEMEISESAIVREQSEDKSDSIRDNVPLKHSCIPKIVIMNNSGSHSNNDSLKSKDTASSTKNKRREKKRRKDQDMRASVLTEGQRGEVARSEAAAISSEPRLQVSGWTKLSLATASKALDKHSAMERADISPSYTSDEWEADSNKSDTDDDHTDSSDDDDPKSQVDRLIERGTLMYMDGENSALSSEDESDYSDEYDSESDITDVSPLVSATASPLGLSPVLPRRTIPTSPLALHDNRELSLEYDHTQSPFDWNNPSPPENFNISDTNEVPTEDNSDSTNMDLLLQAVIELENQNNMEAYNLNHNTHNTNISGLPGHQNDQVFIHPIRDNPHHLHLRKNYLNRKNMSFSNEEVRKIDHDNKILLKKIMAAHTRTKPTLTSPQQSTNRAYTKPSNSSANRKREEKIRRENLLLLRKIQEVKPSKEVVPPIGGIDPLISSVGVSNRRLRSPTSSCGAFMRSIVQPPHVGVPPPRKETAL